jgi:hypothetical protein
LVPLKCEFPNRLSRLIFVRRQRVPLQGVARIFIAALLSYVPTAGIGQDNIDRVGEIDSLTLRWTGLEHQKDLLQANWRADKPVLEQQLALLEREASELAEYLESFERQQGEVEQRRLELLEEQTMLEREQSVLATSLARVSRELRSLFPQLPPPLFETWREDLARLDGPLLTATEKLQLALDLLGQLDDFDQKITLHETIMPLGDDVEYEVRQIYLGLSHGWYVTADQRFAAAGVADENGWQWTALSDSRPITQVIDILERRVEPQLISIPLILNQPSSVQGN